MRKGCSTWQVLKVLWTIDLTDLIECTRGSCCWRGWCCCCPVSASMQLQLLWHCGYYNVVLLVKNKRIFELHGGNSDKPHLEYLHMDDSYLYVNHHQWQLWVHNCSSKVIGNHLVRYLYCCATNNKREDNLMQCHRRWIIFLTLCGWAAIYPSRMWLGDVFCRIAR